MAAKIEWTAIDYAAKNRLARIIDDSGLAYRVIAERMGGTVSHVRVGYIHNGEKSPVRLSEFLAICDVCHADPVATLREIIAKAQRIQAEQDAREREGSAEPDFLAMAAKHGDIEAEQEAYEELP
ncbi:hypothetical protein [Bifidobacterium sp. UTCIF-24]|uniref:hypothetical protein n=1 Tax=Bifidobacterium sp. UTCIF-24 TaxID=1465256 RepID=UPI001DC9C8D5|nr:hypothetical protein [Bifidobacterium sp. UTCIF-24]TPF81188.1 hypothetical protein BW08_00690 [Bifidobacterium sp. UTCIF-24]